MIFTFVAILLLHTVCTSVYNTRALVIVHGSHRNSGALAIKPDLMCVLGSPFAEVGVTVRVSISCQLKASGANTYFLHRSFPASRKRLCQLLFTVYALGDETTPAIPTRTIKKKKIRKGGKATRIAEWRSGSERGGAPAVGPRISLPGPSHLCDDSHPPYRPRPDSESLPHRS